MRVYLGLGTNLGDKESNLHVAVRKINERIGEVTALSAFYVTAPWGFSSENSFLNLLPVAWRVCFLPWIYCGKHRR